MKKIQMAISAILFSALAVYGFAQKNYRDVEAEESRIAVQRHEARVIKALNLNAKQKANYDNLQAQIKSESAQLANLGSGAAVRGREINAKLHNGMKSIFTPAQYKKYTDMWAPVDFSGGQGPMASGTPFGGTDEGILTYLKITPTQWAQYRAYQKENEVKLEQYRQLFKQDRNKGAWFGNDMAMWTRSEMKRILGEDKYFEWIRLWDQVMHPYIANGAKNAGEVRNPTGSQSGGNTGSERKAGKICG